MSQYVNVEDDNVKLTIDNFEINKLRFIAATRVLSGEKYKRDKKGNYLYDEKGSHILRDQFYKELPERWYAFSTKTNQKRLVDYEYLQENYSLRFLDKVKKMSHGWSACYIEIPPGWNQTIDNLPPTVKAGHCLHYHQKPGKRTCLIITFANLLHHCNVQSHANEVFNRRYMLIDYPGVFNKF